MTLDNPDFDDLDYDREDGITKGEFRVRHIVLLISEVKRAVEELNLIIDEYYATHWRDDDCPLQETATGTTRRLAA